MNAIFSIRNLMFLLILAVPSASLAAFTNVTQTAGLTTTDIRSGVAWGDYDDDGCVDLFVSGRDSNTLHLNNCDGTFTDVTAAVGIVEPANDSKGVAWADYDNDGDFDIYVSDFLVDTLWQNNADGTFTNVAVEAGVNNNEVGWHASFIDFDADGWRDLYVINGDVVVETRPNRNRLYHNYRS